MVLYFFGTSVNLHFPPILTALIFATSIMVRQKDFIIVLHNKLNKVFESNG